MNNKKWVMLSALLAVSLLGSCQSNSQADKRNQQATNFMNKTDKADSVWKSKLSPEEYRVLREKGTERAFTGKYNDFKEKGIFTCAACGNELFSSEAKYDSGSGWPSFYKPISKNAVEEETDRSHGMVRTEVLCNDCGGHLGHVFPDGPEPTGMRYCINSVSMDFKKND
jgi:peptide-methionine (R)-S-oxide reductase